jgi:hypothetical protein
MMEVYTDELFGQIDIDEFVKNEIESKAIVVIDEIDKLVRSVINDTSLMYFFREILNQLLRHRMKESNTICYPFWMAPPFR